MLALFIVLASLVYLQIGWQLSAKSIDIWKEKNNDKLGAFLRFPVSSYRGLIGNGRADSALSDMFNADGSPDGRGFYRFCMLFFWILPLVIWNLPALCILGPDRAIKSLARRHKQKKAKRAEAAKKAAVVKSTVEKLSELSAKYEDIGRKISELRAEAEVESLEDPEVVRCHAGAAASKKQTEGGGAW